MTYYTANFAEVEREVITAFNKRFPFITVEMVRAPGGQLITRVKTEAAAGKLTADVIDHSDRGLMLELVDLFQDYAPPNAHFLISLIFVVFYLLSLCFSSLSLTLSFRSFKSSIKLEYSFQSSSSSQDVSLAF